MEGYGKERRPLEEQNKTKEKKEEHKRAKDNNGEDAEQTQKTLNIDISQIDLKGTT